MEIKNILSKDMDPYAKLERSQSAHAEEAAKKAKSGAASGGDRATLSAQARLRGEAFTVALNASDTRPEKVARLREQVETGTYKINPKAIAAKILEEDRLILGG